MTRVLPPRGLLIALIAQLPLALSTASTASRTPLRPSAIEIAAGAALLIAGITLNIWSTRLFARSGVGVCPFSRVPVVIESGPYRLTRNPMYVGLLCINVSVALFCGVPANVWSSIAYAIWLHYAFVLPEEAFLMKELGSPYADYSRRVPRWLIRQSAESMVRATRH